MDDDIVQAMGFVRKEGVTVHVRWTVYTRSLN